MRDESTVGSSVDTRTRPASLLVIAQGFVRTFPLPRTGGPLSIGRSPEVELSVDDPTLSRAHARVHVEPSLEIEDLGSFNGTRWMGQPLDRGARRPLSIGDVLELGSVRVVVQGPSVLAGHPRIWPHESFENRVEAECAAAKAAGFALLYFRLEGAGDDATAERDLLSAFEKTDPIARFGPHEYEALLSSADLESAREKAAQVVRRLSTSAWRVQTGIACYPGDGRSAAELLSKAWDEAVPRSVTREDPPLSPSAKMARAFELADRAAKSDFTVLIVGETGVGKDVMAERVHRLSDRGAAPFLCINCAALSESLLESELFGHERGAFTGAVGAKRGLLEAADRGTLLLDEIGELPVTMQAKLLRVLEDGEVMPVGGTTPRKIDVRFLAATNRDLEADVARGRFREDLFYRLTAVVVAIPPLRERVSEIASLARSFAVAAAEQLKKAAAPELSPDVTILLERYRWPGNVRELRNVMQRAVLLSRGGRITTEDLPLERICAGIVPAGPPAERSRPTVAPPASGADAPLLRETIEALERERILDALRRTKGNQSHAAKLLGISRGTLATRIKSYGLLVAKEGERQKGS